jgi:hypothetical protein
MLHYTDSEYIIYLPYHPMSHLEKDVTGHMGPGCTLGTVPVIQLIVRKTHHGRKLQCLGSVPGPYNS